MYDEYLTLGALFASSIAVFYLMVLVCFLFKQKGSHSDKSGQSLIHPLDLLVAGLLFLFFAANWKASGSPQKTDLTTLAPLDLVSQLIFSSGIQIALTLFALLYYPPRRAAIIHHLGLRSTTTDSSSSIKVSRNVWFLSLTLGPATVVVIWLMMGLMLSSGLFEWLQQAFDREMTQDSVRLLQETQSLPVLLTMSLVATIAAPVTEELLFRGYLYPVMRNYTGKALGIILSGAIFSLVHLNMPVFLPLFVFGMLLAVLYETTKSIWPCITAHFIFNFATVAAQLVARFSPDLFPPSS